MDFLKQLKIYLQTAETVLFAFLFGSHASGKVYEKIRCGCCCLFARWLFTGYGKKDLG